ncbi:hypothetical protein JYK14_27485 [Siccirubricoccus sp. KC 17139]|uniref:Uncharacterized protein n=1 Tax=Siccirubricoccus soli TaxID=2899147 RepID=A0ABT1DD67_9PROT|nr:hypothetical protein [Siccirubricoccus soli]MCO6419874.1 hypothetical protein [Siccirubricoccus soli]MCP2686009.1 hypothetical protein [Siccirubricoccus soli]
MSISTPLEAAMPQCLLVLHSLDALEPAARKAFTDSLYEISSEHWAVQEGATLVATGTSPGYLLAHLRGVLRRSGAPEVPLIVTRIRADLAMSGQPEEGAAWLQGLLDEAKD